MARRKRLTLPDPAQATAIAPDGPLETKAFGFAGDPPSRAAPISDMAGAASANAALEALSEEFHAARTGGRMIVDLPLEVIDAGYLVRDRIELSDEDMAPLLDSLRARGQQVPLEVVALAEGRYGLISGLRRLTALRRLAQDAEDGDIATALCLIRQPEDAAEAYLAMVEENEIRAGISFYERARIAVRAAEQGAFPTPREAVKQLFGAVSRSRRSKIYSFLDLYGMLGEAVRFPAAITERQGLALVAALREAPQEVEGLKARLESAEEATPEAENALLNTSLNRKLEPKTPRLPPARTKVLPVEIRRVGSCLVLEGPGVTPDFETKLQVWLSNRD